MQGIQRRPFYNRRNALWPFCILGQAVRENEELVLSGCDAMRAGEKTSVSRKIFLLIPFVLILACRLSIASTPVKPSSSEMDKPVSGTQPSESVTGGASTPGEIVSVPFDSVQIEGMPYRAYQIPGDPYRIVCQEPCRLDERFIFAEYAGFRLAQAALIRLTGVDTLPELQPVDMHLELQDSVCKELPVGHAYVYSDKHQAYTCTEGPGYYPDREEMIRMAARPEAQYFPLHEYMHTIYFGRISGKVGAFEDYRAEFMHDFVVPIPSYAIGILDPVGFCSYRAEDPPGDYGGWLINELCRRNGFQLADLALSLVELDALYRSGGGLSYREGYAHPVPTVAQYRDILDRLLGSDTTPSFAAACWPPEFFGNTYALSGACIPPTISGTPTPVT
jgi:hypothetical protein